MINIDTESDALKRELALVRDTCLVRAARRTANLLTRAYGEHMASTGLEATQFMLLCAIELGNAHSATELAQQVGIERSTLVRNLERTITSNLVLAEPGKGRRLLYRLTPLGLEKLKYALVQWHKARAVLLNALPEGAAEDVLSQLALVRNAVRKSHPHGE